MIKEHERTFQFDRVDAENVRSSRTGRSNDLAVTPQAATRLRNRRVCRGRLQDQDRRITEGVHTDPLIRLPQLVSCLRGLGFDDGCH